MFFNFTQFVILEKLLVLDLALSGVKGLRLFSFNTTAGSCARSSSLFHHGGFYVFGLHALPVFAARD